MAVSFLFLCTTYSRLVPRRSMGRSRPAPPIIYFSGVAKLPQAMTVPVLFGAARM